VTQRAGAAVRLALVGVGHAVWLLGWYVDRRHAKRASWP
jgi:hypothetical protein